MTKVERAFTYHDRAGELRAIADDLRDEEQRTLLSEIAQEYEKMALKLSTAGHRLMGEDVAFAPTGEV
jgi:hypothetical protein